jgi:hypothetical protein
VVDNACYTIIRYHREIPISELASLYHRKIAVSNFPAQVIGKPCNAPPKSKPMVSNKTAKTHTDRLTSKMIDNN